MAKNKSSTTSSPQRHRKTKRKSSKKDVKKEKKVKRCNEKRRSKTLHSSSPAFGNGFGSSSNHENTVGAKSLESSEVFGPALPPHLLKSTIEKPIIGPQMPRNVSNTIASNANEIASSSGIDDDDGNVFGPLPPLPCFTGASMSAPQLDLEQRALELKIAAIDGVSTKDVEQKEREEWMLELPQIGLRGGLAALSTIKRKFHHGREKPDFSDRSAWTKTPQSESSTTKKPIDSRKVAETLRNKAQDMYDQQRDKDQARLAKKYEKKNKRDESLVEIHQKKLREKEREEKLAGLSITERRPFSRDVDLKLIKIDRNQTKSIVDKAKILDTKFASGKTKYL